MISLVLIDQSFAPTAQHAMPRIHFATDPLPLQGNATSLLIKKTNKTQGKFNMGFHFMNLILQDIIDITLPGNATSLLTKKQTRPGKLIMDFIL